MGVTEHLPNLMENTNESKLTPIQEFYSDGKIFITGCTGFLGSILVEKLLRSCPGISTIYLLIRTKKEKDMKARLSELTEGIIFGKLKKECPNFHEKLYGIEGDCALPNLGLSVQDWLMLRNEVNVVFHVAATVSFNEKLKTAVAINVRATDDLVKLAHQMPNLKSFVYVSTLYSNCINSVIEEKLCPAALDFNCIIKMTEDLPENILEKITPTLLDKYPNTYAYTKQIAESIFPANAKGLPLGIHRPSIVVSTYKEPIPGWINNMYGPTGVVAGCYAGILRALYCDSTCNANLVPVDMCVNSIIATGWHVGNVFQEAKKTNRDFQIPVYNYESSNDQPLTWNKFMNILEKAGYKTPSVKMLWYHTFRMINFYPRFILTVLFYHFIPALIFDAAYLCMGKSPRLVKLYVKIHKFSMVISYFCTNHRTVKCENMRKLVDQMSTEDGEIFFSDLKKLDWKEFMESYSIGTRIYLLKDPIETVPEGLKLLRRLFWLHQCTKAVVVTLFLMLLWYLFC